MTTRQCFICGRVGTRWFEQQGAGGWICTAAPACWKRRRAETRALRRAVQKATR